MAELTGNPRTVLTVMPLKKTCWGWRKVRAQEYTGYFKKKKKTLNEVMVGF